MRDMYNGLSSDLSALINNAINNHIQGSEWNTECETIFDTADGLINDINTQLDS